MRGKKLSPKYEEKYGMLLCPHCGSPLLTRETRKGEFECVICNGLVDKLSVEVVMKMVDNFSSEMLREWKIEMKALS